MDAVMDTSDGPAPANPRGATRAGWVLTGLFGLFIPGASVTPKFLALQPVVERYRTRAFARPAYQRAQAAQMADFDSNPPTSKE